MKLLTHLGDRLRIPDIVRHWLRAAGESERHVAEFSTPSERWSSRTATDWADLILRGGYVALAADVLKMRLAGQLNPGLIQPWGPGGPAVPNLGPGTQLMSVLPPSTVYMPDFSAFQTELKGYNEVIRHCLYSRVAYPQAGSLDLPFFQDGPAVGYARTNMETAGTLPGNQMQLICALRFKPLPPFAAYAVTNTAPALAFGETLRLLTNLCWIEGMISGKTYTRVAPADFFPAGNGVGSVHTASGIAATTQNISYANNGFPAQDAIFREDPPLGLLPTRTFSWRYRADVLNPVTAADWDLMFQLDGYMLRAVL